MQFLPDKFHLTGYWARLSIVALGLTSTALATGIAGISLWRSQHRQQGISSVKHSLHSTHTPPPTMAVNVVDVPFRVCAEATAWVRPSPSEQQRELQSLPRYGSQIEQEPLLSLYQRFQNQFVFAFTTYGISLRLEPIYFSGLWTVQSTLRNCYDPDRIAQFNNGQLAEVWVLLHRVVSLQWVGDRYIMVVEPMSQGVQFIQFSRRDRGDILPLQVVTRDGISLDVFSGALAESPRTQ